MLREDRYVENVRNDEEKIQAKIGFMGWTGAYQRQKYS